MRNGRRWITGSRGLVLGLAVTMLLTAGLAGAKGKPPKPPPPDPEPTGPEYALIDLGDLGGGSSKAYGINEAGQVVGGALDADGVWCPFLVTPEDTDGDGEPDRWFRDNNSDGVNDLMVFLGLLGGDASVNGVSRDINDRGLVVGRESIGGTWHGWVWRDLDGDGDSDPGEMIDLGALGEALEALAVNNHGQVLGRMLPPGGSGLPAHSYLITPEDSNGDGEPDLWVKDANEDGVNDLRTDLGEGFERRDINDAGLILGKGSGRVLVLVPEDTDSDGNADNWWLDDDGDGVNDLLVELTGLNGGDDAAACVNASGEVAGSSMTGGRKSYRHAVRWGTDRSPTDLGADGRRANSSGTALNDDGDVVGESDGAGMLWQDGEMYRLLDLLTSTEGLEYVTAADISNSGQIVGWTNRGAFIAIPTGN